MQYTQNVNFITKFPLTPFFIIVTVRTKVFKIYNKDLQTPNSDTLLYRLRRTIVVLHSPD